MVSWRINWAGWVAPKPGNVRVNWGGWVAPRLIYVKDGAGVWRDTGYSSHPGPPTSFHVTSWDYNTVNLQWSGPSAGNGLTAPSGYEVAQNNSNDTARLATKTTTGGTSSFSVGPDGLYKFYVRSYAANGLYSGWAGPIQVGIGHPQQTGIRAAQRSRAFQTGNGQYGMWNGHITGMAVAGLNQSSYSFAIGCYVTDMYLEVWSPYFGHTNQIDGSVYWLGNSAADIGGTMQGFVTGLTWGPSWAATPFRPRWSNGGCWGVWCSGSAYDHKYGPYYPLYENVILAGTEYYAENESYVTVAATSNYYW